MLTSDYLNKPAWWGTVFQLRGSIVLMILPRIFLFSGLTATLALLQALGQPLYLEKLGNLNSSVIYNLILGLLLVFRTNTSYDRFWEGRKAWGSLVVNSRNLAREIQVGVSESAETGTQPPEIEKQAALRLVSAFAIATKLHLRSEPNSEELKALLTPAQVQVLEQAQNRPLILCFWIRHYLQQQFAAGHLAAPLLTSSLLLLNNLTDSVSGCERIITTPIPIAYRVYLQRLILIYCITFPFRTVPELGWWAIPIMAFVSFLLMGVEEVGRQLENPFGYDVNDLPLDALCTTIASNVETTIALGQSLALSPEPEQ